MAWNTRPVQTDDPHMSAVGAEQMNLGDKFGRAPSVLPTALQQFDRLPDSANVRLPVVTALFGCSSATVWRRVKSGAIPPPRKFGGTTVWNVGDLRAALCPIAE